MPDNVASYQEELKKLESDQKIFYEKRKNEINQNIIIFKKCTLLKEEYNSVKARLVNECKKYSEKLKVFQKNEVSYKRQLKQLQENKLELESQLKGFRQQIETLKSAHTKAEKDLLAKIASLEAECQKAKETEEAAVARLRAEYEAKVALIKKDNDRNVCHLVSQYSKSAETAELKLEYEKSENKNNQAIVLNLRKELAELRESSKSQNEKDQRRIGELETSLKNEKSNVINKDNLMSRYVIDLSELETKNILLTNLNESLLRNVQTETACRTASEKILDEIKIEKYDLEHQLAEKNKVMGAYILNVIKL